jgi:hypothetical protein
MDDELLHRVRRAWADLAGAPVDAFSPGQARVTVSPQSRICPSGWAGLIELKGAVVATAPSGKAAERLRIAVSSSPDDASDLIARLLPRIAAAEIKGPAALYYLPLDASVPLADDVIETVPADGDDVRCLLASVSEEDGEESGLASVTSAAFVTRVDGLVVSGAGYRRWPNQIAHLSVLTAVPMRGQRLAIKTAGAAAADALRHGLLPQWRARPIASRRVAERLGFRHLGWQASIRLADPTNT